MEKPLRFLNLFNPWEVEELACVRDSFYHYHRHMLHKYDPDLRNEKPHVHLSEDAHRSFLLGRKQETV